MTVRHSFSAAELTLLARRAQIDVLPGVEPPAVPDEAGWDAVAAGLRRRRVLGPDDHLAEPYRELVEVCLFDEAKVSVSLWQPGGSTELLVFVRGDAATELSAPGDESDGLLLTARAAAALPAEVADMVACPEALDAPALAPVELDGVSFWNREMPLPDDLPERAAAEAARADDGPRKMGSIEVTLFDPEHLEVGRIIDFRDVAQHGLWVQTTAVPYNAALLERLPGPEFHERVRKLVSYVALGNFDDNWDLRRPQQAPSPAPDGGKDGWFARLLRRLR